MKSNIAKKKIYKLLQEAIEDENIAPTKYTALYPILADYLDETGFDVEYTRKAIRTIIDIAIDEQRHYTELLELRKEIFGR